MIVDDPRDIAANEFEHAAGELERSAAHCRVTARHYRNHEIPRAAAHAFAAYGHLVNARQIIDDRAADHAAHSLSEQE